MRTHIKVGRILAQNLLPERKEKMLVLCSKSVFSKKSSSSHFSCLFKLYKAFHKAGKAANFRRPWSKCVFLVQIHLRPQPREGVGRSAQRVVVWRRWLWALGLPGAWSQFLVLQHSRVLGQPSQVSFIGCRKGAWPEIFLRHIFRNLAFSIAFHKECCL